jgi:hypothetical protein
MGFRTLIGVAVAVLGIAGAAVAADEAPPKPDDMVNTPPFQHWGAFNVGTRVTQKQVVSLPDGRKVEQVIVHRLVKNDPKHVVVETVVTDNSTAVAETTRTVTTYLPMIRMGEVGLTSPDTTLTEGKEEMTVKGTKTEAEWTATETRNGDDVWKEKTWTARDVPGGIIRDTLVHEQGGKVVSDSVLELVDFKLGS